MSADTICELTLQSVGPFDLPLAAALHARCFDDPWREGAIADLLAMPGSFGFLASLAGQPVGLAIALAAGGEGEILTLCVAPECRRKGVGSRLLAEVSNRLGKEGCWRLSLEVAVDNLPACFLYARAGFAEIGRRAGYYRRAKGQTAAAIVLAAALIVAPE